eukprot:3612761-Rhodomonas_salina.1
MLPRLEPAGPCDVAEYCTGQHLPRRQGARGLPRQTGDCKIEDVCDGSGGHCHDMQVDKGTVRSVPGAVGLCDVAETCQGDAACPDDAVVAFGVPCQAVAGDCQMAADVCPGPDIAQAKVCADEKKPSESDHAASETLSPAAATSRSTAPASITPARRSGGETQSGIIGRSSVPTTASWRAAWIRRTSSPASTCASAATEPHCNVGCNKQTEFRTESRT